MSYAAPTTYAAPQMSYVPQATYGGYPGAATHSPYLDEKTIKQQETDATAALDGQASMQTKMLEHQYSHQKEMKKKMATLYSGAGAAATTGTTEKKAATTKKA